MFASMMWSNRRLDDAEAPGAVVERNELRAGITRALAQLPPTLREAFVMHYVEDMPYETMAELLDASVSALKMRTLRAREALKSALRQADVTGERPVSSVCQTPMNGGFEEAMMNYGVAVAIVAMALSGAARVNAQAQPPQERINAALARAQQAGIPVALLESKIAEGKAKGVSLERIAVAIERRQGALERASQALRGGADAASTLAVGADAIEAGVSEAVLRAVGEDAPRDRRSVAIAALTELVHRGNTPEAALVRVRDALRRGPDALSNLPAEAAAGRRGGGRGGQPDEGRGNQPEGDRSNQPGREPPGNARGRGGAETPSAAVPPPGQPPQSNRPDRSGQDPGRGRGRGQ